MKRQGGSIQYWHEVDDQPGVYLTIEYAYWPATKGHCDRYGVPEEPDDGPEVEITSIKDEAGNEVELPESVIEQLLEDCLVDVERAAENAAIDRAEARAEYYGEP